MLSLSRGKTARFFNNGYLIRIEEPWKQYFKIRQQEIRSAVISNLLNFALICIKFEVASRSTARNIESLKIAKKIDA